MQTLKACAFGALQEASFRDLEMPGQWYTGEELQPDAIVRIERIGADVQVVRRHCSSYRRLKFYGSDGRMRQFLIQTGQHFPVTGSIPLPLLTNWAYFFPPRTFVAKMPREVWAEVEPAQILATCYPLLLVSEVIWSYPSVFTERSFLLDRWF